MTKAALLVENVRLPGMGAASLLLGEGRILDIATGAPGDPGCPRHDGEEALVLPPLADGHIHLDKTLLGLPFTPHIPGATVAERIAAEEALRRDRDLDIRAAGSALIAQAAGFGTLAMRSHADVTPTTGLAHIEAVLDLRRSHRDLMHIEVVAFPQAGLVGTPGVADLLDRALAAGADLVGGLDPAGIDGEITGQLDTVFRLAERHGAGVDIHLHDRGTLGAFELRRIAAQTLRHGLSGRVTVSHAYCLGELSPDEFARTAADLAAAGVAILTNAPAHVPMPPVEALEAAGVVVFLGSDNIRDAWSPFGNGDMIARAALLCGRQNWRADADLARAYRLASEIPARMLGLPAGPLEKGAPADFLLIRAASAAEAVATQTQIRTVFRAGRPIARNGTVARSNP